MRKAGVARVLARPGAGGPTASRDGAFGADPDGGEHTALPKSSPRRYHGGSPETARQRNPAGGRSGPTAREKGEPDSYV